VGTRSFKTVSYFITWITKNFIFLTRNAARKAKARFALNSNLLLVLFLYQAIFSSDALLNLEQSFYLHYFTDSIYFILQNVYNLDYIRDSIYFT
jgi:hypothetical protein